MSSGRYQEFITERARLLERIKELEAENAELRKRLGEPVAPMPTASCSMKNLSLHEKIDLFCSLFKGRNDVFARRWFSKTSGKAGYQPVCQNEWTPLCDKRKYKCADCPNRQFSRLTYNAKSVSFRCLRASCGSVPTPELRCPDSFQLYPLRNHPSE